MSDNVRLPNSSQRIAIVGRTGSGKTVAGLWHLSKTNFDTHPWVIIDYKTDEHINAIERAEKIDLSSVPKRKGIYIVHPLPSQEEEVTEFLWKIWQQENTGIYVDEGYMLGKNKAFETCLVQGRSKHIPMIVLSQRPVWISRFVFSESDFFQIFHLNDERDRKTVEAFIPVDMDDRLPDYYSRYYDVGRDSLVTFSPVPKPDATLEVINTRLESRKRTL
jgi:hypothetical protein